MMGLHAAIRSNKPTPADAVRRTISVFSRGNFLIKFIFSRFLQRSAGRKFPVLPIMGNRPGSKSRRFAVTILVFGVDPTVVSPGAIWIIRAAAGHSYIEFETAVGIHMIPDQRRQGSQVSWGELAGPLRLHQNLLEHKRVDIDHAVLRSE